MMSSCMAPIRWVAAQLQRQCDGDTIGSHMAPVQWVAVSPAPGVGSHISVVCLWTRVSSGNWPMFNTKSRKCRAPLEGPAGTEYLEDAALEQRGKVRGSQRSPRR